MQRSKPVRQRLFAWLCLVVIGLQAACQPIQAPLAATIPSAVAPRVEAPFAGTYNGQLSIAGLELTITVQLQATGDSYSGVIDIPEQGATGIPLHDIVLAPPQISFQMLEGAQLGTFTGEIDAAQNFSGTFSQAGYDGTFALTRSDEPPTTQATAPEAATADPSREIYQDPQGLFTAPIPTNWTATEGDGFVLLSDPEQKLKVYLLTAAVQDGELAAAIKAGWAKVDPAFALAPRDTLAPPATDGLEKNLVITYDTPKERIVQGAAALYKGIAYLFLFDGDLVTVQKRAAQINIIQSGLDILALEKSDLSAATPLPVDDKITGELATFITQWLPKFKIPGAAVAIIQNGAIVYSQGFGARNERGDPITAQTRMMIGSTGKSLTTLMMATLVDDGKLQWDTPAAELYPPFAVKDPALSKTITMRNLVCACTGVPRRDLEFILNANELSAEDTVASLRDFEFFTDFGEAFQYSNQMVATGGYLAAVADSGEQSDLFDNYVAALQARVLDPLAMTRTTVSFDTVLADNNYATPHGYNYQNEYVPITPELEKVLVPVAPAGAHWSTLEDMSKYMIMQLNDGVTAEGTRVVSVANLDEVRKPQIKIADKTSYGLGWIISDYKGQPMIDHGGNTLGFTSEFKFLPQAHLGIIVLTNAQATNIFSGAISERLLELVFQQPSTVETSLDFVRQQIAEASATLAKQLDVTLDRSAVEPYLGDYHSDTVGGMTITLEADGLHADFGEFGSALLPKNDEKGAFEGYMLAEPPLPGLLLTFKDGADGKPSVVMGAGVVEYTFAKDE